MVTDGNPEHRFHRLERLRYAVVVVRVRPAGQMRRRGLREVLCRAKSVGEAVEALQAPTPADELD